MHTKLACLAVLFLAPTLPAQRGGTSSHELEIGGAKREYLLHIPRNYKRKASKAVPLLLMLHGRGSSNKAAASRYYGWIPLSEKKGFIAVFPNALGSPRSWQPAWGGRKSKDGAFLAALIEKLETSMKIDKNRVFMTGHSSGAIMSFSFAATHSAMIAAIGPVAGTIGSGRFTIPAPKAPMSVISFHGMADRIVPYDAERGKNAAYPMLIGAPESVAFWVKHDGCKAKPVRTDENRGKIHVDTWADGKSGTRIEFYSIEKGSHAWPSRRRSVDATHLIWEFFEKHARRPAGAKTRSKHKPQQQRKKKNESRLRMPVSPQP